MIDCNIMNHAIFKYTTEVNVDETKPTKNNTNNHNVNKDV